MFSRRVAPGIKLRLYEINDAAPIFAEVATIHDSYVQNRNCV